MILGAIIVGAVALVDVFVGGQEGFNTYRIPSIICAKSGTMLAFAEGRAGRGDQSQNKIVLKRSTDGGKTWSRVQQLADGGKGSLNNPCAVVEQTTGRVLLMYQSYPPGVREHNKDLVPGYDGERVVRNWLLTSDDDGKTWSAPRDATKSCKAPTEATTIASGPGIGIQLTHGAHAGRLIMPFNEGPIGFWNVYAAFSDDRGQTWQMGQRPPGARVPNSKGNMTSLVNEVQMVELADGGVMLNSRSWGGKRVRKTAVSRDGGETWSTVVEDENLHEPRCMASILRYSFDKNVLLYSGPDASDRRNGTVRVSRDDGQSWPVKKVLEPGKFAYSCLTRLPDDTIGCLYETGVKDAYETIKLALFPLDWLTAP